MTKLEALAKDCIENHTHRLVDKPTKQDIYLREESIFIQGYRQSEKRIAELKKETADLKERLLKVENAYKRKFEAEWRLNDLYQKLRTDYANAEKCSREYFRRYIKRAEQLTKAKEIIRDLLSCLYSVEYDYVSDLEQAEAFLSSSENPNK